MAICTRPLSVNRRQQYNTSPRPGKAIHVLWKAVPLSISKHACVPLAATLRSIKRVSKFNTYLNLLPEYIHSLNYNIVLNCLFKLAIVYCPKVILGYSEPP
uniref:Uncharacterized protein n=1 Tax=Sphaerodactylus townsendi TaxID=933632 RepID=A0ACB8F9I8_9SAUR